MRSMATATPTLESEQRDVASHAGDAPAVHRPTMEPGAFQRLPIVASAKELVRTSVRRASRVGNNNKLKNEAAKARNRASRAMDTLMKEMCGPLGQYRSGFPSRERLHPFDAALLDLTVGAERYRRTLAQLEAFKKTAVQVTKMYANRAVKASNMREAIEIREEALAQVELALTTGEEVELAWVFRARVLPDDPCGSSVLRRAAVVDELKDIARNLRRLPVVDLSGATVALVGAPNVGKSSLVQLLSSGLPEVCDYPFTTRSIKVGHFFVDGMRHQVTDTPGLLARPDPERNAMERLTLATLLHLPTSVVFVADLTGQCGTSVGKQWAIRQELKARFPNKPWLDVCSKADLLEAEFRVADAHRAGQGTTQPPEALTTAVEWAVHVPEALRVSATTEQGLDGLKVSLSDTVRAALESLDAWVDAEEA
ncbi:hypothetical protein APUTEX25_002605 [Auxenochlorella protothecoides]|uniref:Nucleolar GTP-binding protein 1 n=1 Tax=Auxenochlorella protothecoides TaxID=3075 RepID=A0A3M7KU14_AUXPR|nr:hypothetical protein APUTEX25_002605 [Auxenochlorella protothecoides]|eukprot:RMZ54028.1 hypothetical protein APUTEX25_002605 [Auxenochlorella protothecoides]